MSYEIKLHLAGFYVLGIQLTLGFGRTLGARFDLNKKSDTHQNRYEESRKHRAMSNTCLAKRTRLSRLNLNDTLPLSLNAPVSNWRR